jgi:hypothetical protein
MAFLVYDKNNLVFAPARVLLAPSSATAPAEQSDIYAAKAPYTVVDPWFDAGATSAAPQITRTITVGGPNIQQSQDAPFEEVDSVERTLAVPFAEISKTLLVILEQSATTTTAVRDKITFGSIESLQTYRIALAVRRSQQQGVVQEGSTLASAVLRGRDLIWMGYLANLTGDNVQLSFGRNELAAGTLTFKLRPDPTFTTAGQEEGLWWDEKARVIP